MRVKMSYSNREHLQITSNRTGTSQVSRDT